MNDFLASLTPALRGQVTAALESDPDARVRLTAAASPYIDADGNWPTESATAQMIASQFLHTQGAVAATYGASGLGSVALGGLTGGAVTLAQAKGAVVLSHWVMANYWQDTIAYAYGINPDYIRVFKKVMDRVTKDTHWEQVVKDLTVPSGPTEIELLFGDGYAQIVERELVGTMKKSAWKGARSALSHVAEGVIGNFAAENPWVEPYVRRFARNQADLANETIMGVVNRAQEQGLPPRSIAQRLREQWSLTPRYAQAVDNHRLGLMKQERSARTVAEQTRRYAQRLRDSRLTTMAQTEALTTFHLAREAQWIRAVNDGSMPLDTQKMWVTAKDELVCKVCRPMDGQTAPLGSPFEGEVTLLAPTAHPNCRCIIIPVTGVGVADVSRSKKLVFPAASPVSKHLGGPDGTQPHPSGTTQDVHSGKGSPEDTVSEKVWDFAAFALSRGEIRDRSELNAQMRKRNQRASRPMRRMRSGKIMDFSTRQLGFMTEGYGFRLGNNNHVKAFANKMLAGDDVFTFRGRKDPIMVMVYDDGAQVLDGKHRLAAAQMAGVRKVPVQVARVRKPMPEPEGLRQEWDELRRNLVRYQYANAEIPAKPSEPFDVRTPYKFEVAFNEWMQVRSAVRDEERFLEYGVTRGTKPKRFRRS